MTRGPSAYLTDEERAQRKRAYSIMNKAIRDGLLVRGACESCGTVEAHHRNGYADPLDVVWLCSHHHQMEHYAMNAAERERRTPPPDDPAFAAAYAEYRAIIDEANHRGYQLLMAAYEGRAARRKGRTDDQPLP